VGDESATPQVQIDVLGEKKKTPQIFAGHSQQFPQRKGLLLNRQALGSATSSSLES
jgi:hypothetical protein